jgi:acyl-coenzyme A synthetase/AMP-(fatty) acid ligase
VDTYWQTETGGHLLTPLPGITPTKPGSCCLPMYGIEPVLLDAATGAEIEGNGVEGGLFERGPWNISLVRFEDCGSRVGPEVLFRECLKAPTDE